MSRELKVGSKIWMFDSNHRVYRKLAPGESWGYGRGGPIYREYWRETEITGETRVSWITVLGKCPKRGSRGWIFTRHELDLDVWANEHRHILARKVQEASTTQLALVAEAVGYDKPAPLWTQLS